MTMQLSIDNEDSLYTFVFHFVRNRSVAKQFVKTILHMVKHHGVEFTVNWLKNKKAALILWYSLGNPKLGRPTFTYGLRPLLYMELERALSILNVYTCVVYGDATKTQLAKFHDAVSSTDGATDMPSVFDEELCAVVEKIRLPNDLNVERPEIWLSSSSKRMPSFLPYSVIEMLPENSGWDEVIASVAYMSDPVKDILKEHRRVCSKLLFTDPISFLCLFSNRKQYELKLIDNSVVNYIGTIGYIQERGGKLRCVANPHRIFQILLEPLGHFLYDILRSLPWDCTFDQARGVSFAHESLIANKTCYSFDLSNATDKFPVEFQLRVIRMLIMRFNGSQATYSDITKGDLLELVKILQFICAEGVWKSRLEGIDVKWTRGQPLGLYPSFAMFALAHGTLVRTLERSLGKVNTFRVLGDDIIINDDDVAALYSGMMNYLGCQFSPTKTLVSNRFAEFAGKVVNANGEIVIPKWEPFSFKNPLGPLKSIGIDGLKFVPPNFRDSLKLWARLPEPVGLGLNPEGKPLRDSLVADIVSAYADSVETRTVLPLYKNQFDFVKLSWNSVKNPWLDSFMGYRPPIEQKGVVHSNLFIQHYNACISGLEYWETLPSQVAVPSCHPSFERELYVFPGALNYPLKVVLRYARALRSNLRGKVTDE